MKTKTDQVFITLQVITWIVFIGLLIETGALIFSTFFTTFINPVGAHSFYKGINLSGLLEYSITLFIAIVSLVIGISGFKAYLAYQVVNIFQKLNLNHPFSPEIAKNIRNISSISFMIGIMTIITTGFKNWMVKREIINHELGDLLGGSLEFLFFAGIILIIAKVFERGIEIQSENELTI